MVLVGWNPDEAGPYQAIPPRGASWQPLGQAARQPHADERAGTAKLLTLLILLILLTLLTLLTLLHSATGQVRVTR